MSEFRYAWPIGDNEYKVIKDSTGCDLVYMCSDNHTYLERFVLHDGYNLWRVHATVSQTYKFCVYVIAKVGEARKVFMSHYDFLHGKIDTNISLLDNEDAERILCDPTHFLILLPR